ncbi:hypothetical protein AAHE18_20G022100 [Arachis hypogaea]
MAEPSLVGNRFCKSKGLNSHFPNATFKSRWTLLCSPSCLTCACLRPKIKTINMAGAGKLIISLEAGRHKVFTSNDPAEKEYQVKNNYKESLIKMRLTRK